MSNYRDHAPSPLNSGGIDSEYDYKAGSPAAPSSPGAMKPEVDGEDALMDLAQLEELHMEAEKMKALGNKHMAAQEYTRAYNAYSAALQLSPVGPSSHVFLSNRAAALLSLKRYSAAATDARRAVALSPNFGKAHARLGQALYFLKDYEGAVAAYQDAIHYEPDNQVTRTYLEKAKTKMERHRRNNHRNELQSHGMNRDDGTSATVTSTASSVPTASTTPHSALSVVTDHHNTGVMMASSYKNARSTPVLATAVAGTSKSISPPTATAQVTTVSSMDDPDLEEALRIQHRANSYLANKEYTAAIEEYTAALFLVPDDPILSPNLHLGRAHALNGSRRHERAKTDALLAIRLQPSPAAYSTLAKSLFYMKDFRGAIDAFAKCIELLPPGESLGMFDRAYLQKAEAALEEEDASLRTAGQIHNDAASRSSASVVPKLPPPRFVPREQALHATPTFPPMPKEWPQQSPTATFKCGPEKSVMFLSESLGVKLNRGSDGVVRVLWVAKEEPGSPIARQGDIQVGHVIREAAGVDLRRPITNIMWGDTVALIKMAPRPITLIVAQEMSEVPLTVMEEIKKANEGKLPPSVKHSSFAMERPSPASGDEAVRLETEPQPAEQPCTSDIARDIGTDEADSLPSLMQPELQQSTGVDGLHSLASDIVLPSDELGDAGNDQATREQGAEPEVETSDTAAARVSEVNAVLISDPSVEGCETTGDDDKPTIPPETSGIESQVVTVATGDDDRPTIPAETSAIESQVVTMVPFGEQPIPEPTPPSPPCAESIPEPTPPSPPLPLSSRLEEERIVGGEILFERPSPPSYSGWDNLRWLAFSGERKVRHFQSCYRLLEAEKKTMFWSRSSASSYVPRRLAIYEEPKLILVLRKPLNLKEVNDVLGLPDIAQLDEADSSIDDYWLVESVVDPVFCKLRLSTLTTVCSLPPKDADERRKSCIELITPTESILLSAVRVRDEAKNRERSFSDSGAFLETSATETALVKAICGGHHQVTDVGIVGTDISWKHQYILGTLHSYVVSGDVKSLDEAILAAKCKASAAEPEESARVLRRVIDEVDDNGLTPLYYACARRMSHAAASLVAAGANIGFRFGPSNASLAHVCSRNLDHKCLSVILSASNTPSNQSIANLVDDLGRTPMYIAATEGTSASGSLDSVSLSRCIMALEAWGGTLCISYPPMSLEHPVSVLAGLWRPEELSIVLDHTRVRYPLQQSTGSVPVDEAPSQSHSLSSMYQYPVHHALASLRTSLDSTNEKDDSAPEGCLIRTLRLLLEHSFEPNERLDAVGASMGWAQEYVGFTPLQVLGAVALDVVPGDGIDNDSSAPERIRKIVGDAAQFLVRNGARLSVDPPMSSRPGDTATLSGSSQQLDEGSNHSNRSTDRSKLKLDAKDILQLLGGADRLKVAQKEWAELRAVEATSNVTFLDSDGDRATSNKSDKACVICWKEFGSMLNRRHRCRVTNRIVCDACSSKRLLSSGAELRVTDGQFLLARIDAAKEQAELAHAKAKADEERVAEAEKVRAQARADRLKAEEHANRDTLLGGLVGQATNFVFGADTDDGGSALAATRKLDGLSASMSETRNALLERGAKLESLGEKSSQMVEASADFARMAKELRKKSESQGLFW